MHSGVILALPALAGLAHARECECTKTAIPVGNSTVTTTEKNTITMTETVTETVHSAVRIPSRETSGTTTSNIAASQVPERSFTITGFLSHTEGFSSSSPSSSSSSSSQGASHSDSASAPGRFTTVTHFLNDTTTATSTVKQIPPSTVTLIIPSSTKTTPSKASSRITPTVLPTTLPTPSPTTNPTSTNDGRHCGPPNSRNTSSPGSIIDVILVCDGTGSLSFYTSPTETTTTFATVTSNFSTTTGNTSFSKSKGGPLKGRCKNNGDFNCVGKVNGAFQQCLGNEWWQLQPVPEGMECVDHQGIYYTEEINTDPENEGRARKLARFRVG